MKHGRREAPRRKRRLAPLLLLVLLPALCWELYSSNYRLSAEAYTVPLADLPQAFDGLKIVHLSDLHGAVFGENNGDLLRAVAEAKPDLIALTGDLLDRFRETPHSYAAELAAALTEIAPTYFVTGNHEWALPETTELKKLLQQAGVTVLSNRFAVLEQEGQQLIIAGIDDPNGFADQKIPEELAAEITFAHPNTCWLLLAHRNDRFEAQYSLLGADLVLSGHGHGGIIRPPFTDGLVGTNRDLFPSYTCGIYEENGSTLFVSRGIGNSGPSFRLLNRPQVAILTLVQA